MVSETEHSDRTTEIYCECGNNTYKPIDNRTKEVMILKCLSCGNKQEWRLKGHNDQSYIR
jgi:hypothetical protein